MKLLMFKSAWGMGEAMPQMFEKIANAGYDGIESWLPAARDKALFAELLDRHKLQFIPMLFTEGPDHLASFEQQLEAAAIWKPLKVTAHSSRDHLPIEAQLEFFRGALALEAKLGIEVGHESHRGRALYTPWNTARILKELPGLRLTADYSHWCCVTESLLQDFPDDMRLANQRSIHIHGRVGHAQGPQVGHPADAQWKVALECHETWWRTIIREQVMKGEQRFTFTPEFGPVPYMPTQPFTGEPVSDLWDTCLYMAGKFRKTFAAELEVLKLPASAAVR